MYLYLPLAQLYCIEFPFHLLFGERGLGYHWDYTKGVVSNSHLLWQILLRKHQLQLW